MPASGTALQSSKGGIASELGEGPRGPARFKGTAAELWALQVPRSLGRQGGITTLLGSGPGAKAVVKSTAQHQEAAFSRRGAEGRCSHGAAP